MAEILDVHRKWTQLWYKIKWTSYDKDLDGYIASDLKGCLHKLRDFHKAHPKKPGPLKRLQHWLKAWEDDLPLKIKDQSQIFII